ncbi:expressed unknown protein [Seminavis robusta]|uniref:Uncharacterized protein n=1 Tax=Seminavis robusta TaxID=568900 RepID=A0A9N8H6I2_9STRA|nr:expressed unknown protein [Seminavis robusta]|eukprot:Sro44_g026710.1 n/a (504) ;mRNA; f:127033-128544
MMMVSALCPWRSVFLFLLLCLCLGATQAAIDHVSVSQDGKHVVTVANGELFYMSGTNVHDEGAWHRYGKPPHDLGGPTRVVQASVGNNGWMWVIVKSWRYFTFAVNPTTHEWVQMATPEFQEIHTTATGYTFGIRASDGVIMNRNNVNANDISTWHEYASLTETGFAKSLALGPSGPSAVKANGQLFQFGGQWWASGIHGCQSLSRYVVGGVEKAFWIRASDQTLVHEADMWQTWTAGNRQYPANAPKMIQLQVAADGTTLWGVSQDQETLQYCPGSTATTTNCRTIQGPVFDLHLHVSKNGQHVMATHMGEVFYMNGIAADGAWTKLGGYCRKAYVSNYNFQFCIAGDHTLWHRDGKFPTAQWERVANLMTMTALGLGETGAELLFVSKDNRNVYKRNDWNEGYSWFSGPAAIQVDLDHHANTGCVIDTNLDWYCLYADGARVNGDGKAHSLSLQKGNHMHVASAEPGRKLERLQDSKNIAGKPPITLDNDLKFISATADNR